MKSTIVGIVIGVLLVVSGVSLYGFFTQRNQIAILQSQLDIMKKQTQTQPTPASQDQSKVSEKITVKSPSDTGSLKVTTEWFGQNSWTKWYEAASKNGQLALSYLKKIGESKPVSSVATRQLYFEKGFVDYSREKAGDYITLLNCAEASVKTGGEWTPGFISIDIYSLDKTVVDGGLHEIYLSNELEEDELKNRWPILYGPYRENVSNLVSSFGDLQCITAVPK